MFRFQRNDNTHFVRDKVVAFNVFNESLFVR